MPILLLIAFAAIAVARIDYSHFATMKIADLLRDTEGKQLLGPFLRMGHRTSESVAMKALRCYNICNEMLTSDRFTENDFENLDEVLPSHVWEKRLLSAGDDVDDLIPLLERLRFESLRTIELSHDYELFKLSLLNKLKS